MMTYLQFDFAAVWSDLRLMSAARERRACRCGTSAGRSSKGLADLLPLVLLALLVSIATTLRPLIWTALVFIGGGLVLATNAQPSGYPLNALLAILLVEHGRAAIKDPTSRLQSDTILVLLGLICYAPVFFSNASGVAYAL